MTCNKSLSISTILIFFLFHDLHIVDSCQSAKNVVTNVFKGIIRKIDAILPLPSKPSISTPADLVECYYETLSSHYESDPDIKRRMPEFVEVHGYHVQTHSVTTEDGYVLTIFRVRNQANLDKKLRVVLLNHGLGATSTQWFLQTGDRNLGMALADAGYDVWVTNHRGTSYSSEHVNLTQADKKYWDFSWHEMGVYDVPAILKYILSETGNSKLYYVGHSMGTTQFLVAMSEHPELNDKIETAFLLAPVAYLSHSTNIIRKLAFLAYGEKYLTMQILEGGYKRSGLARYFNTSIGEVCSTFQLTCPVCNNLVYLYTGYDAPQTNYPRLAVALSKYPDTAATKCSVHFAQSMAYYPPSFRQFDYLTPEENEKHYGKGVVEPPSYNLTKVTCKIVALYGPNDNLATPTDARITFKKLGIAPQNERNRLIEVPWPLFNHFDFAIAKDADVLVYGTIFDEIGWNSK